MTMIPGLISTHSQMMRKTNFRRAQVLEQMSMGKMEAPQLLGATSAPVQMPQRIPPKTTNESTFRFRGVGAGTGAGPSSSTKYRSDPTQPSWITNDRQVLRFFGYFQEKAIEREREVIRIRRIVLCFYLSDDSISISEPRVANSGMMQGEFMKRTLVSKPDGSRFSPGDFAIGAQVKLFGRVFHFVDCDDATRTYYEEALGAPLESAHKYPDDKSSHVDEIEALKAKLRQKTSALEVSKAQQVRKFHENSQKVLRFYVSWRDPHPLYPATRHYVLHFYLSDDTIEIVEPKQQSPGGQRPKGQFAVLVSRRKIAKDSEKNHSRPRNAAPTESIVTERDLRCGEWLKVFSRSFLLEDCDAFTRDYYLEKHGITQERFDPPNETAQERALKWELFKPKQPNPPRDNQQPKPNANDAKFYQQKDAQLRFRARFHACPPGDLNAGREFVVTYFVEDDTLSVYEPRVKNSGVVGGRFLDRGRFRKCFHPGDGDTLTREKQKERSMYRASDFYVGAVVGFEFSPNQRLELIEADLQTLNYCESHPDEFPYSDPVLLLENLAKVASASGQTNWRELCQRLDEQRTRTLNMEQVRTLLERIGVYSKLKTQQVVTLCRAFEFIAAVDNNSSPTKRFVYDDFCDAIAVRTPKSKDSKYPSLTKIANLRQLLRSVDEQSIGVVPIDVLLDVTSSYHVIMTKAEIEQLVQQYSSKRMVEYQSLCNDVFQLPTTVIKRDDSSASRAKAETSIPTHRMLDDQDDGSWDEDAFDQGDEATAPSSVMSQRKRDIKESQRRPPDRPESTQRSSSSLNPSSHSSSSRVVDLLHRIFGSKKYQLRKALRDRDRDKTGMLTEEGFIDAVLAVEPKLSDDDTYLIADVYFPTNNCSIDYAKLLESAFRTRI